MLKSRVHVVSIHEYLNMQVDANMICLLIMLGSLVPNMTYFLNRLAWYDSYDIFSKQVKLTRYLKQIIY